MNDRGSGNVGLDDTIVVIKRDTSKRRNKDTNSSRVAQNKKNVVCRTLVLDDNNGSAFVRLSLGKQGDGGSTSRSRNTGVGMGKPLNKRAGELYDRGHD